MRHFTHDLKNIMSLAVVAHDGQHRKNTKIGYDKAIPYIEHPLKVCRILEEIIGDDDIALLGAALLHDVIEDTIYDTQDKLTAALIESGISHNTARDICAIVQELTNPDIMPEGKRTHQTQHIKNASDKAKMVKIADQIANVIDILEMPSEKINISYANKARDVYKSASGVNDVLDQSFKVVYELTRNALHYSPLGFSGVLNVDIKALVATARKHIDENAESSLPAGSNVAQYLVDDNYKEKHAGLVAVALDKRGDVIGYTTIVSPDEPFDTSQANQTTHLLRENIEHYVRRRVTTDDCVTLQNNNQNYRMFHVKPSVSMDKFTKAAAQCTSSDFLEALETTIMPSR